MKTKITFAWARVRLNILLLLMPWVALGMAQAAQAATTHISISSGTPPTSVQVSHTPITLSLTGTPDQTPTAGAECNLAHKLWTWTSNIGTMSYDQDGHATWTYLPERAGQFSLTITATIDWDSGCTITHGSGQWPNTNPPVYNFQVWQKVWDPILTPGGGIVAQRTAPTLPAVTEVNSDLACSVSASDLDTYWIETNGNYTRDTDESTGTASDTLKYQWYGGGTFTSPTSASTNWHAPSLPGIYTLSCDVDDIAPPPTFPEIGARSDSLVTISFQVVVYRVAVYVNGVDRTGSSAVRPAGVQTTLEGRVEPQNAGLSLTNPYWDIGGDRVSDYVTSTSAGVVSPLPEHPLGDSVSLYWYNAGNAGVTYHVTVNGHADQASCQVVVTKTSGTMTASGGTTGVDTNYWPGAQVTQDWVHYGTNQPGTGNVGVLFEVSGLDPGVYAFAQLGTVITDHHVFNPREESWALYQGLDTVFPYNSVWVNPPNNTIARTSDSPGNGVGVDRAFYVGFTDFHMYLLYKPDGAGPAIYIPISKVDWSWTASATRPSTSDPWQDLQTSSSVSGGTANPYFPVWSTHIDPLNPTIGPVITPE